MKQEFVTSTGTVIVERDVLYVRKKLDVIPRKMVLRNIFALCFLIRFIAAFSEEPVSKRNFEIFLYGVGTVILLGPIVYDLVTKSYAKRIPLRQIEFYRTEEDINGLETHVHLTLPLGRTRTFSFRKLENQLGPFLETLATFQIYEREPQLT